MDCIGRVDYHVHYYLDGCANPEMTLPNIDQKAREMGLEEITVLKHYSQALPNGEKDWVSWHVIKEDEFSVYLDQMKNYHPDAGLRIFSGVETELTDEEGNINIPKRQQEKIDCIALSVHYMPLFKKIETPFLYHPRAQKELLESDKKAGREFARWKELVRDLTPAYFVESLVQGYVKAMEEHPKICQLAHMYDGLFPLRDYHVPYQEIPEKQLIAMMEPLMTAAAKHRVLWELLPEPVGNVNILKRAAEMGVKFVASADGHSMYGTWGRFTDHPLAEKMIDELGLPKGVRHY